jgi:DNA repair exonuclease SbcCD ATPase subunit
MFMLSTQRKRPTEPPDEPPAAPPQTGKRDSPSPDDARSEETERLEQALVEERQHAAALRATVEDLRFKATILEKSYAKQLADARARAETAERGLAEEKARLAGIDGNHENTLKLLSETRGQLAQVMAECDLLRKQLGSSSSSGTRRTEPVAAYYQHPPAPAPESELTINTLMADLSKVAEERRSPLARREEKPAEEPPAEDMLSADVVFPKKRDDKKED